MSYQYVITSDKTELAKGTEFYVWPCEAETGQFVVFAIGKRIGLGYWYPNVAGIDFVHQPRQMRVIACLPEDAVRVLGVIILKETPPAEIGELSETERAAALRIARALK